MPSSNSTPRMLTSACRWNRIYGATGPIRAGLPARVVEIGANHYTITAHDASIAAIGAFLRTS
jgi:hypothetical protein